ncbi:MAG: OadG family transporter subunit [Bacteroidales bacterium]|nr:OadG family transporter subunit [Bacteroidales bacterium]
MKVNIIKTVVLFLSLVFSLSISAQKKATIETMQQEIDSLKSQIANVNAGGTYDPLVPQTYAVDSKTQTVAVINHNENTVEILVPIKDGFKKEIVLLVDVVAGRHDEYAIYRPKSIAIYDNHIVYLASNRDSSFVRVINFKGELNQEYRFNGAASAFSYIPDTKQLYIAGDNVNGYNIFAIDVKQGFEHIDIANSPLFNYVKPMKGDEISKHDPYGLGLTLIAVSTVFLALIVIFLFLLLFKNTIINLQDRKARKQEAKDSKQAGPKSIASISGEEFAAIAAAIYMYDDQLHDEENTILTINKVSKTYSPWSSKLHNMNVYRR